jgi:hypothetical protein
VIIRGGAWTAKHKGVAADSVAGIARGGVGTTWCKMFKYPQMNSFAFSKFGEANANQLAREFCRRGQFFLNLCVESEEEDHNFAYTEKLLSSYVETADFLEFAISLDIESLSFARAMELRKLVPSVKSILVKRSCNYHCLWHHPPSCGMTLAVAWAHRGPYRCIGVWGHVHMNLTIQRRMLHSLPIITISKHIDIVGPIGARNGAHLISGLDH